MFPKLLELGPITLHTYGLLLALAFLVSTSLMAHLAEKDGLPRNRAWDLGFVVILCALAGAKLLMVLTNWSVYAANPGRFLTLEFWQAGGAFFGGLIGAFVGSYLFVRRLPGVPFSKIADAAAPAIALGQCLGRIGCFAAGCDYGRPTDLPWGITFTSEYAHQNVNVPLNQPLHPVQLYESLGTFILFLLLYRMHGRRSFDGQVISLYFLGYGILRFGNEFFRGDRTGDFPLPGIVSLHQLIALGLVLLALGAYLAWSRRRPIKHRAS